MRTSAVLLSASLLALVAACGAEEPAPEPTLTPAQQVQQVWKGWTKAERTATCKHFREEPAEAVDMMFPSDFGIPREVVAAHLKKSC